MQAPTQGNDHRGVAACAVLAVVAVILGITAVVADEATLGLAAAVVGVAAAGVGALVDVRRSRAEDSLWEARSQARRLRRQLETLQVAVAEEHRLASARAAQVELPEGTDTADWEIDPVSGLIRERHLPVLLQQVVAAARRKVLPVSVVFWELDGLETAPLEVREQALTALGAVAWRTLRESDTVFRLGDAVAVAVLVDTAEPGARMVADRVREALRASPVGDSLTASAGIACYPSHALDAAELVARAGHALEQAREAGHARDYIAVADQGA
jgi:diguanylate cyclase (GGDEF)-like protein